jgi:uncharacterized protein DUF3592
VGANKARLSRDSIARVQFRLDDGRTHEANVDEIKLRSHKLSIGATLPVIYAPDNPADVRAEMSWETFKVPLILFAIGIPFLVLSLGAPLAALFRRFRGLGEESLASNSEHLAAATQLSGRGNGNIGQRNPVADIAVGAYSRTAGMATRASFGMRNR